MPTELQIRAAADAIAEANPGMGQFDSRKTARIALEAAKRHQPATPLWPGAPRVVGLGRVANNARSVQVAFDAVPDDDDLRRLHDFLRGAP